MTAPAGLVTESVETAIGLRFDCPRCGTRHLIACCHASPHNLCDPCVLEQRARAALAAAEPDAGERQ